MGLIQIPQDTNKEITQQQVLAAINALITLLPSSIGQKDSADSLSVTIASDQTVPVSDSNIDMSLIAFLEQNRIALSEITQELKKTNELLKAILST